MINQLHIEDGTPFPLGLSFKEDRCNFAVFSQHATAVILGLFTDQQDSPAQEIPLKRSENIWHIAIQGLPPQTTYSFRCEGPYDEKAGFLYKPNRWLADPYAKAIKGQTRATVEKPKEFDWQGDLPLRIPAANLIIYEMHVRGFTKHPSSEVSEPGTFLGIIEKIPYFKELGVNALELMPIFEYDETHFKSNDPNHLHLVNYWGYSPLHFFIPKQKYASADPIDEFKTLVRECHKNGIEVILDVVYNHTGEGTDFNYQINFKGLDNPVYYYFDDKGYHNYSGCGNTFNCNHPTVQQFIIDSLRYWVEEMHVDGFRFDLASVLTRGLNGHPMDDPPLIKAIISDPVVSKVKLIAEPWDPAGLYHKGSFGRWGPWMEWDDQYRDIVRRFLRGTEHASAFTRVLTGSKDMFTTNLKAVLFVTSHDGFSLRDLVTYNEKHNEENGEQNRDGHNHNESWNCGAEGPTQDENILQLRERQMRNFFLALFLAQGVPMLTMGDEYGLTHHGNNNPYAQDNELNWFSWSELRKNKKIFDFVSSLITFRKRHSPIGKEMEWHGKEPFKPDWGSHFIACTFKEPAVYLAFNANSEPANITLPPVPGFTWHEVIHTAKGWDQHLFLTPNEGLQISIADLPPFSALVAILKPS